MKQHTAFGLIVTLVGALVAVGCGSDNPKGSSGADSSGSDSSGSGSGPSDSLSGSSAPTGATGSTSPNSTSANSGGSGNSTGTDSVGGLESLTGATDTASTGPTCTISSLAVFTRSDTEDVWDDNDFSDVTTEGSCPLLVNVTWPHEAGWEDADPSEANQEQTHFTLDSFYSLNLTGKQLNLTIELVEDVRGPEATAGGYEVGLVSVSSYQYQNVVPIATSAPVDAGGGGDAGVTEIVAADASLDGGGLLPDAEVVPTDMTLTLTGYSEAESAAEDRIILRHVGDRATVRFALPNKGADVDSYDPASVIKINARIYNMFSAPPEVEVPGDAGVWDAGDAGDVLESTSASSSASSSSAVSSSASSASGSSSSVSSSEAASSATGSDATSTAPAPTSNARVYGYLTSKFAITDFSVTDAE